MLLYVLVVVVHSTVEFVTLRNWWTPEDDYKEDWGCRYFLTCRFLNIPSTTLWWHVSNRFGFPNDTMCLSLSLLSLLWHPVFDTLTVRENVQRLCRRVRLLPSSGQPLPLPLVCWIAKSAKKPEKLVSLSIVSLRLLTLMWTFFRKVYGKSKCAEAIMISYTTTTAEKVERKTQFVEKWLFWSTHSTYFYH